MKNNAVFHSLADDYFAIAKDYDLSNFEGDFADENECREALAEFLFYSTEDVLLHLETIAKDARFTDRATQLIEEIKNELASV